MEVIPSSSSIISSEVQFSKAEAPIEVIPFPSLQ